MPLPFAAKLTEYLDRAAYVYQWPLYPPLESWSPEPARPRKTPAWMEAERRASERWRTNEVRVTPHPILRLGIARREVLAHRLTHLNAHGRTPRVALYSLNPLRERSALTFAGPRAYATGEGWRIAADHCIADRIRKTDPMHRPGWRWALHLVHAGLVDGVVVAAQTDISPHLDEYELQLDLMAHYGGFVALVTSESVTAKRRATRPMDEAEVAYGMAEGEMRSARLNSAAQSTLSHCPLLGGAQ
ncbi:hypothetical protein [Streptomyces sp. NPDC050392]|uniref:hypothetical protein n=1 Tax=Streptomyces sp. NPDC050392 TaxID=3155782 RepID=UPI0034303C0A